MFDFFKNAAVKFVPFTDDELLQFISCFKILELKKKDLFLTEGQNNKYQAFINKGMLRYYYVKDGKEYTRKFFVRGEWTGDYSTFLTQLPSSAYIEALTDVELFLLSFDKMQSLYDSSSKFERFGRRIAEHVYSELVQTTAALLIETPEERYFKLVRNQPYLLEGDIPLYQIASFLGIMPESLSRIRKRIIKSANRA